VIPLGSFQVDERGVADQVLGGQQSAPRQPGMDSGQGMGVGRGGEVVASSAITLALPEAHVSVTWAANPFQLMMCPCRT
jgi:hypothetical protein